MKKIYSLLLGIAISSGTSGAFSNSLSLSPISRHSRVAQERVGTTLSMKSLHTTTTLPHATQYLFTTKTGTTPYRIPAITTTQSGRVIALTDLRPGGADIGMGLTHIVVRTSEDGGNTWTAESFLGRGTNNKNDGYKHSYGDAAIVADVESDNVLVHTVAGSVSYWAATAENPQRMAHFRSVDGGRTWDSGTEVTNTFTDLFKNRKNGAMSGMFLTSGRIVQSRYVKKNNFYRLYAALCTKEGNFAVYSDDFGYTWAILGDPEESPISDGDEVKCEELPDGSVILSSRANGSRLFNIFNFTDALNGKGNWAKRAVSNATNNGIVPLSNATNGEALMVPVRRLSDNRAMYLLFHTIPFGTGRTNVGVYYKEIGTYVQGGTPERLATNWTKSIQLSTMGSAYSALTLQKNDSIGFLFEESTHGRDYTIVYQRYSVEELTNGLYALDYSVRMKTDSLYTQTAVEGRISTVVKGALVGQVRDLTPIQIAKDAYLANPSFETANAVTAAIYDPNNRICVENGKWYRLTNKLYPTASLSSNGNTLTSAVKSVTNVNLLFQAKALTDGSWYLLHGNQQVYPDSIKADNVATPVSNVARTPYVINSAPNGESVLRCTQTQNKKHAFLHRANSGNIVGWTNYADASQWFIEPVDSFNLTLDVTPVSGEFYRTYYLPFSYTLPEGATAFKATSMTADSVLLSEIETVPEKTGVLLKYAKRTLHVQLLDNSLTLTDNIFDGVLVNKTLSDVLNFYSSRTVAPSFRRTTNTVVGNRAYLVNADGVERYPSFAGAVTGIGRLGKVETEGENNIPIYDLTGRRVFRMSKGLYIVKGKKMIR